MKNAEFYSSTADILADTFTVVSYDMRCNSRSCGDRKADMTNKTSPYYLSRKFLGLLVATYIALSIKRFTLHVRKVP